MPISRSHYLGIFVAVLIILSIIVIIVPTRLCSCGSNKLESFCGCSGGGQVELFTTSIYCPERLVYNGRNYELWRDNIITHVFRTMDEYKAYWNFAYGSAMKKDIVPCALLTPMQRTGNDGVIGQNGQGSILAVEYIQEPRFYNIEHFIGQNGSQIESFVGSDDSARDVSIDSSSLLTLSESNQRDEYLRQSQEIMANYMLRNNDCYKRIKSRDGDFYRMFQESYAAFIRHQFLLRLGYVPDRPQLRDLNLEEASHYIEILSTLPDCQSLIVHYSPYAQKEGERGASAVERGTEYKTGVTKVGESTIPTEGEKKKWKAEKDAKKESEKKESEKKGAKEPRKKSAPAYEEDLERESDRPFGNKVLTVEADVTEIKPMVDYIRTVGSEIGSTVKGLFSFGIPLSSIGESLFRSKPSTSVEDKKSSDVFGSAYSTASATKKTPEKEQPREEKEKPESIVTPAPNQLAMKQTMHRLSSKQYAQDASVSRVPVEYTIREKSVRPEFQAPVVAPSEVMNEYDKKLLELSRGRMQPIGTQDVALEYTDGEGRDSTPGVASQHIASNFAYTTTTEKPVKEPSRKIASTYGWTFIPKEFWSVPQKRPPICLPETGKVSNVVPIYDKSVPLDVLDWTQVKYETEGDLEERPIDPSFLQSHYANGLYMSEDQHTRN